MQQQIGLGTYTLTYSITDTNGVTAERTVKLNIEESKPVIRHINLNNVYIGYEINFADYVYSVTDVFGNNIKDNLEVTFTYKGKNYVKGESVIFNETGTIDVTYKVTNRESTTTLVRTYNIITNVTNPVPEISVLSNYSNSAYYEGEKELTQNDVVNLCNLVVATDNGNNQKIKAKSMTLTNSKGEVLLDSFNCNTSNYSKRFNEYGGYLITYIFEDRMGLTTEYKLKTYVLPFINNISNINDIPTDQEDTYFRISLRYIGFANDQYHFVDSYGNSTYVNYSNYFTMNKELVIGETFTAIFRTEYTNYVFVDKVTIFELTQYEKSFDLEYLNNIEFASTKLTCITNILEDKEYNYGTIIDADFSIYKKKGNIYLSDKCDTVLLSDIETKVEGLSTLSYGMSYKGEYMYSINGIVTISSISSSKLPNKFLSTPYIVMYLLIGLSIYGLYELYKAFKTRKNNKINAINIDESSGINYSKEELKLHRELYAKIIEKRYVSIINVMRKSAQMDKIRRNETYHEYIEKLAKKLNENVEDFVFLTDIYTRCRYYKESVNKLHFQYVEVFYQNNYDRLQNNCNSNLKSLKTEKRSS